MESCCPQGICWKTWLQRLQTCTATASTIMVRSQDFNSSSRALLWLPAELDLGSPLLQPAPWCCCPCSQTWGRASHTVPVGAGRRSIPGERHQSLHQQHLHSPSSSSGRVPEGPPLSQPPGSGCFHSRRCHLLQQDPPLLSPVHLRTAQSGLPEGRSWRQDVQLASRQSLPSSWEELHDKAG